MGERFKAQIMAFGTTDVIRIGQTFPTAPAGRMNLALKHSTRCKRDSHA
jgi:hypothetical protein